MSTSTPECPPLPVGNFTITINTFRPFGGVFPISATFTPYSDNPSNIAILGKNITVTGADPVQLAFHLPNPVTPDDLGYVLLGVAFAANSAEITVGMHTFPEIKITRSYDTGPSGESIMVVTDKPQGMEQHYGYVILVQSVATGEIGMIDPEIVNRENQT